MRYKIHIEQDEDGIFVVECTSLPGCISQGKTRKEALENIKDAIKGYLERNIMNPYLFRLGKSSLLMILL
jgi:predicted RNase H-like HicB family nuclease